MTYDLSLHPDDERIGVFNNLNGLIRFSRNPLQGLLIPNFLSYRVQNRILQFIHQQRPTETTQDVYRVTLANGMAKKQTDGYAILREAVPEAHDTGVQVARALRDYQEQIVIFLIIINFAKKSCVSAGFHYDGFVGEPYQLLHAAIGFDEQCSPQTEWVIPRTFSHEQMDRLRKDKTPLAQHPYRHRIRQTGSGDLFVMKGHSDVHRDPKRFGILHRAPNPKHTRVTMAWFCQP